MHIISQCKTILAQKHSKYILLPLLTILLFVNMSGVARASTIAVSNSSTAAVANTGEYIYFDTATYGANVTINDATRQMNGYAWSTDMGWLYFGSGADNPAGPVQISASGAVSGKAKFLNGNYLDFNASPSASNVTVQSVTGAFSGYAWSEDLGWINFGNVVAPGFYLDTLPPDNPASVTATSNPGNNPITNNSYYGYNNINFSWTAPTDYANVVAPTGVAGYYVYFGINGTATPYSTGTYNAGTSVTLPVNNLYSSQQYFRIQTIDNAGNISSPVTLFNYSFFNDTFSLITPANSATGVNVMPEFRVTSSDTLQVLRYKIDVCSTSNCSSIVRTIDQTALSTGWTLQKQQPNNTTIVMHQYQPAALTASTQYWWRVASIDPPGANIWSAYSAISTFTTGVATPATVNIKGNVNIGGNVIIKP